MERVEHMPKGPQWSLREITVEGYRADRPIVLYHRDAVECTEYILNNPLFGKHMSFVPVQHFDDDGNRVIKDPISAQQAWETQVFIIHFLIKTC